MIDKSGMFPIFMKKRSTRNYCATFDGTAVAKMAAN
jgi:hypothetical protein